MLKDPCLRVPCGHVACATCIERDPVACAECGVKQTALVPHRAMADMLTILPNYAVSLEAALAHLFETTRELTDELRVKPATEFAQRRRRSSVVDIGIALLRQEVEG